MRDRKRDLGRIFGSRWPPGVLEPHEHDDEDSNLESEQSSRHSTTATLPKDNGCLAEIHQQVRERVQMSGSID